MVDLQTRDRGSRPGVAPASAIHKAPIELVEFNSVRIDELGGEFRWALVASQLAELRGRAQRQGGNPWRLKSCAPVFRDRGLEQVEEATINIKCPRLISGRSRRRKWTSVITFDGVWI